MTSLTTSNLKRLLGVWKTSGSMLTESQTLKLSGTDTYELILNENFILHKADVFIGNEKSETHEIISLTNTTDKAKMQYFNANGESGLMTSEMIGNDFHINGEGIKFRGTINNENTLITGNWFLLTKNNNWIKYIELKLEKQNSE